MTEEAWVVRAGRMPYADAVSLQARLREARHRGAVPDLVLQVEHPPTYTRGRRSLPAELPMGEEWYRRQGIEVAATDRGGRVTYHGPGQVVAYPIFDLAPYRHDVHDFLRRLESAIGEALRAWGVEAGPIDGLTGVWVGARPHARKIASIGIHVSRGITTHGLAVNVNNDLQPFAWIVPCGIEGCEVTSLCRELGAEQDASAFADTLRASLGAALEREPVEVSTDELAEAIGPAAGVPAGVR
jgi:lipoyl(octanoyl) transferase